MNCFRNQIIIEENAIPSTRTIIMFGQKTRHIIHLSDKQQLLELVCDAVKKDVVNAIVCELPVLAFIQNKLVIDILDKNEQKEIIAAEHNRAHRAAQENIKQILQDYFFPKLTRLVNEAVANCKVCNRAKYDRHPQKQVIGETPIPSQVGEILHIDIFSTVKKHFLTCIDKFSKFAIVQPIASRTIVDIEPPILQLMNFFPSAKTIYCDNEPSLNSGTIMSLLNNRFNVQIANAPPLHSTSNGQVERFHSTLAEIARCLKIEKHLNDTVELILQSTIEYN